MIDHIIAGEHPGAMPLGQGIDAIEPGAVVAVEARCTGDPDPPRRLSAEMIQGFFRQPPVALVRHEDEKLALRVILRWSLFGLRCRIAGAEEIAEDQPGIAL